MQPGQSNAAIKMIPGDGWLKTIIYVLLFFTLTGLIFSRALLSISQGLWIVTSVIFCKNWWQGLKRDRLLLWSIIPIALFAGGAWQGGGRHSFNYLFSMLNYPAAILALRLSMTVMSLSMIARCWVLITILSLAKPLYHLLGDSESLYLLYTRAKTLGLWMDGDHVRYGLLLCSGLLMLVNMELFKKKWKYFLTGTLLIMILLISIRTGWVGATIILAIYFLEKLLRQS